MRTLKNFLKKLINISRYIDFAIKQNYIERKNSHPNPFCKYGAQVFSQSDEDGITNEIINRLKINNGFFIELGVGDGTENNTLFLSFRGWKGLWIGAQKIKFNSSGIGIKFVKTWINKKNIINLIVENLPNKTKINLISIDLDGNDYYIVEEILKNNICPDIFICEYNAKFIPPLEFIVEYDENHTYKFDDHFGASLQSYSKLFNKYGYKLICCNAATGSNAFFVKNDYKKKFLDIPKDISQIFVEPNYIVPTKKGHDISIKTIQRSNK